MSFTLKVVTLNLLNLRRDHDRWPGRLSLAAQGMLAELPHLAGLQRVLSARRAFDQPAEGDPALYASDHYGLAAEIEFQL